MFSRTALTLLFLVNLGPLGWLQQLHLKPETQALDLRKGKICTHAHASASQLEMHDRGHKSKLMEW